MHNHSSHLGSDFASRDPAHLARWQAAVLAGRARAPRCTAIAKSGERCQLPGMKFSDPCRCHRHLHGLARDLTDERRRPWLEALSRRASRPVMSSTARKALAAIERRRLHRAWLRDPTIPGSTLLLAPDDEARVAETLLHRFGVDLNNETHTERARDRLKWACVRMLGGADPIKAGYRVNAALRDDERWRKRTCA
ncbi:hypothetical protein [uncultured Bosea sp.]|uniref:hypothetical protein n=1 Tax=uncultured Bosea sp. TaxID=211457 RepID=UPI0025FE8628|nr:hypothetical protein [uncultured Bosea sp.]